jgi:hypothetical protein
MSYAPGDRGPSVAAAVAAAGSPVRLQLARGGALRELVITPIGSPPRSATNHDRGRR